MSEKQFAELKNDGYAVWVEDLKQRVKYAQSRAATAANTHLVMLYWSIGKDILIKQSVEGWGVGVIGRLAQDLRQEFPDMRGFSPRNLGYMKKFAEIWTDEQFLQTVSAKLSWSHNCALLDKISINQERAWYAVAALKHGWSLNVLVHQIENRLIDRQGAALNNFQQTLPSPQSELAAQTIKDPYVFDFLTHARKIPADLV